MISMCPDDHRRRQRWRPRDDDDECDHDDRHHHRDDENENDDYNHRHPRRRERRRRRRRKLNRDATVVVFVLVLVPVLVFFVAASPVAIASQGRTAKVVDDVPATVICGIRRGNYRRILRRRHLDDGGSKIELDGDPHANLGIVYTHSVGSRESSRPMIVSQTSTHSVPSGEEEEEEDAPSTRTNEIGEGDGIIIDAADAEEGVVEEDDDPPPDTILDDLIRGFAFAASFSIFVIAMYQICVRCCVKCGWMTDDRVIEARRWRMRLRNKRSYHRQHDDDSRGVYGDDDFPPLDTRMWGEWMARRQRVGTALDSYDDRGGGGIGDSAVHDREVDEFGFEMPELEYGEGDELEDVSHDSRLFDDEDGGAGAEREAERFFGGGRAGGGGGGVGVGGGGRRMKIIARGGRGGNDKVGVMSSRSINGSNKTPQSLPPSDSEGRRNGIVSDETFDALRPPNDAGGTGDDSSFAPHAGRDGNGADNSSSSAAVVNYPFAPTKHGTDGEDDAKGGRDYNHNDDDDDYPDEDSNGSIQEDDRGYDHDTDLLGLRSDSPPPLDIEEMSRIEKRLVEDMENAKLY